MLTILPNLVFPMFVTILALYLFYILLLRNDNLFLANRLYIVGSLLFVLAIPWIHFTIIVPTTTAIEILPMETAFYAEQTDADLIANSSRFLDFIYSSGFWLTITMVYLAGVAFFFGLLLFKSLQFARLIYTSPKEKCNNYILVYTDKNIRPVSFFKYIVINDLNYTEAEKNAIILHEQQHIKQRHSLDMLLMEMMIVLQWFNPIIRLYRKELRNVHEYSADQGVLRSGITMNSYMQLLFLHATGMKIIEIGNNFSQSLTSKRIKMMKKIKHSSWGAAKIFLVMPIVALLLFTFSVTTKCEGNDHSNSTFGLNYDTYEAVTIGDSVYILVEQVPEYPGGQAEMMRFLSQNITYPEKAEENGVQGTVHVNFIVEKDGSITEVKILRGIGSGCDEEALRVVNMMPKWKPGQSEGKPVRVHFNLPIRFSISNSSESSKTEIGFSEKSSQQKQNVLGKDSAYIVVEQMPEYPGGRAEMMRFLSQNITYPEKAEKNGIQGTVHVNFIVEKDGSITEAKVIRGIGSGCDEEALRVVNMMPKWKPGLSEGKPVRVHFNLPIRFSISNSSESSKTEIGSSEKSSQQKQNVLGKDSAYIVVEQMPEYPGGRAEMMRFLSQNITYPEKAEKNKVQGTVFVSFIVEKDGSITEVKILRGIGSGCDEEALRVVKMMPKWEPGLSEGKPVRVHFNLPIKFSVN